MEKDAGLYCDLNGENFSNMIISLYVEEWCCDFRKGKLLQLASKFKLGTEKTLAAD